MPVVSYNGGYCRGCETLTWGVRSPRWHSVFTAPAAVVTFVTTASLPHCPRFCDFLRHQLSGITCCPRTVKLTVTVIEDLPVASAVQFSPDAQLGTAGDPEEGGPRGRGTPGARGCSAQGAQQWLLPRGSLGVGALGGCPADPSLMGTKEEGFPSSSCGRTPLKPVSLRGAPCF